MIARIRSLFATVSRLNGRFLLTVMYFTVVLPFGVVARVRASVRMARPVAWQGRQQRSGDLTEARKQF